MTPTNFKEANKDLLKPQGMTDNECGSLPVMTDGKQCLSCWQMTWKERFAALFFGKVWLCVLSGQTQPPVWMQCEKSVFETEKQSLKIRLHNAIYARYLVDRKYLNWWWMTVVWRQPLLPFYMDFPFSKYYLAIWNCGNSWEDLRITIKEIDGGAWMFTIKQGDHEDLKRCSKYFAPFGMPVGRWLDSGKQVDGEMD